jgi:squalene-hopene/tetraprenyl-beta-curcumene cyclase
MNDIHTKEVAMLRRRVDAARLDEAVTRAEESLVALQHPDGHWVFELEADVTIPSEFILLQHYFGRIEPGLQARIAGYIRAIQGADGGWPLFHGGALDLSASVKAYFALKAAGDPVDAPHMERARAAILARGGARRCNVFTPPRCPTGHALFSCRCWS